MQLLKTLILSSLNLLSLDGRRFLVAEAREYFVDSPLGSFSSAQGTPTFPRDHPGAL